MCPSELEAVAPTTKWRYLCNKNAEHGNEFEAGIKAKALPVALIALPHFWLQHFLNADFFPSLFFWVNGIDDQTNVFFSTWPSFFPLKC